MAADLAALADRAYSVKKRFLAMYKAANAGHVGSSLSCAEMLVFLKFAWMGKDDTLILSKGHAAAALYSLLAEEGALSEADIASFYKDGTYLSAHPPVNKIAGIPFATGSLGHGLSLLSGMAIGARLKGGPRRFFCITSDGELDEGSLWEAALFIAHMKLTEIFWLIDRNNLQGIGRTEDVMALEPLEAKLRSFGFFVTMCDGHDFASLARAKAACQENLQANARPSVIVCSTIKGRGLNALADTVDCHYLPLKDDQYQQLLRDLDQEHGGTRGDG